MNNSEAVALVGYLSRAGLLQALEGQGPVWADLLDDVDFNDAKEAARRIGRARTGAQRWATPGDIREGVSQIRRERTHNVTPAAPPRDLEDEPRAVIAWQRTYMRAIGDGLTPEQADERACAEHHVKRIGTEHPRPVDQVVDRTARAMPRIPPKE